MEPAPTGLVDAPFERRVVIARLESLHARYARILEWFDADAIGRRRAGQDLLLRHPTGLREALEIDADEAERRRASVREELERVRAAAPLPPAELARRRIHALADLEAWMLQVRAARRALRSSDRAPSPAAHPALAALAEAAPAERLGTLVAWLEARHGVEKWWQWVWGPRAEEQDVGALDDFPVGSPVAVEGSQERLVVVRRSDGVFAASAACPHRGGDMAGADLEGDALICPVHGWAFSLDDGSTAADPSCRLPLYDVRIVAGRVRVRARSC